MPENTWLVEFEGTMTDEVQTALHQAGIILVGGREGSATPANRHYVWVCASSSEEAVANVSTALERCGSFLAFIAGPAGNGPEPES